MAPDVTPMGISTVILTKNEEYQIRRCLDSLKGFADEIIIVDDHSTDRTAAIAKEEYGARVIAHALNNRFDEQRNIGTEACQHEWVLHMDADEVIPPSAAQAMAEAVRGTASDAYAIPRRDCVWEVPLKYVGRAYQTKLFRKSKGRHSGAIHESLHTQGRIRRLEVEILHYPIPSVGRMLEKQNHYSDLEAQKFWAENPQITINTIKKNLIFKPFKIFFKHYVKHGGYKDGVPGLVWSTVHTLHPMMFWMKVLERRAGRPAPRSTHAG